MVEREARFASLAVVVPVLDEAGEITIWLRHIARLLPGASVVVADGGSRDGTVDAVTSLLERQYHRAQDAMLEDVSVQVVTAPRGRGPQLRVGARQALEGPGPRLLLFLHVDTALTTEAAAAIGNVLDDPAFGWGWFDVRLDGPSRWERLIEHLFSRRARLTGRPTGDQGLLVTRQLYLEVGGYAAIPMFEDTDLVDRLRRVVRGRRLPGWVVTSGRRFRRGGYLAVLLRRGAIRLRLLPGDSPQEQTSRQGTPGSRQGQPPQSP
jgi:rSAM/selenodomain-associated transferase 2